MNNGIKFQTVKDESNVNKNKNNMPFYLMTLEDNNGECKQIKIYQNSDPFELSYNFCKENNLDFESMKYVKKNIKEIIKKFNEDEHYIMVEEEYYEDEDEDEDEYKKKINNNELKNNKNKKSTNELICSLVKKNIKLNHSKINKIAPLQKKINEDIQKIYKSKKKELFNSPDLAKENKNNNIFRNNNYHLLKNKIIYKVNKTIAVNDLKNKRYKLYKKNTSNDNKKMNTFSFKNEFCEYGVPELKSNNSINMIKYTSKIPKNKELSIVTKEENDEIKSGSRKFENEDDNEKNKSSSKEEIKKDKELQNLIEKSDIIKDGNYENYAEKFFKQPYFLYVLEMLILEDIQESNTLKVFRQNKNLLPIKVVKENFFRDEIKKHLISKTSQIEYKISSQQLIKNIDQYMDKISQFEI